MSVALEERTARSAPAKPAPDLLGWLTVLLVVILGIPSALIVKPLGAQGTPGGILAILMLCWWLFSRAIGHERRRPTASHVVTGFFVAAMLASYVHGMLRPISGLELSSADRGLLALLTWSGLVVGVADGLRSLETLQRFLFRLTVGGGVVAALGIIQFFTGINISDIIRVPGLVANHPFGAAGHRADYLRVTATTLHPIEFGIVLALILPSALHFALHGPTRRARRVARLATALMLVAMPMTVARSAMLGLAVVLIMLFFSWDLRHKIQTLIVAPVAAVGMKLAIPGLLGTIRSLFLHAGQDPSIQNRLGDYAAAGYYISRDPLIGRGFFTFLPGVYRTLDNQYMGMLIEAGAIGLAALLALMLVGAGTGIRVRRRSTDAATRSLAFALATSMVTALITFFTFDAFAFPMVTSVLFLLLGGIGALTRCVPATPPSDAMERKAGGQQHGVPSVRSGSHGRSRPPVLHRRLLLRSCAFGVALVVLVLGARWIDRTPAKYSATASLVLAGGPPTATLATALFTKPRYLGDFPALLATAVTSPAERMAIAAAGHRGTYEVAVGDGSLEPGTDVAGSGNLLRVGVTADSPGQALGTLDTVVDTIHATLRAWQQHYAVATYAQVRVQAEYLPVAAVAELPSRHRALAVLAFLVVWGWWLVDAALRRRQPA